MEVANQANVVALRPRFAKTRTALAYIGLGRTKFYELVKTLDISPVQVGRDAFWKTEDLDRVADFIADGGAASKGER